MPGGVAGVAESPLRAPMPISGAIWPWGDLGLGLGAWGLGQRRSAEWRGSEKSFRELVLV